MTPTASASFRRVTGRRSGQVMVLACVALFILALMLSLGFSLSNAIHERVRIQSHADATAFSAATLAARSFNVTAYSNRAIAAAVVSSMSVHAWMTLASMTISILGRGASDFNAMAGMEFALCCSCKYCSCVKHCKHGMKDLKIAKKYKSEKSDYTDKVEGVESKFNDVVEAFNKAAVDLHKLQVDALSKAMTEASTESTVLSRLRSTNAPRSKYETSLLSINAKEIACALEGHPKDGSCQKLVGSVPDKSDKAKRSAVMQNAVNAARIAFLRSCSPCVSSMYVPDWLPGSSYFVQDIQSGGDSEVHTFDLKAALGGSAGDTSPGDQTQAVSVGAKASGNMMNAKYCFAMGGGISSKAWSDKNGGSHSPGHTANHDKFKGIQQADDPCGGEDSCFVNFRANSDKDIDFNQPSQWAGVSQDLGVFRAGNRGAWEINKDARIRVKYGEGVEADIVLKPKGTGVAVAKAKVYYHQLKHWQYQPTLFDPFWRAKLHFFKRSELSKALQLAGDGEGASVVNGGGAVEGGK